MVKGVPITTPCMLGAQNMEHNTGTQVTRAARVEQNSEKKAKPSTLYQVYMCIKLNSNNIVIYQKEIHVRTWKQLHLQLAMP